MRFYDIMFNLETSNKADLLYEVGAMALQKGLNTGVRDKLHFVLDETNPYAMRVTFNIQHFSDAAVYVPSVLTLYNAPTAFFGQSGQALVGASVVVKAGIRPSVYTSKLNLTTEVNTLLYVGNVARVVPQYTGKDPSVAILLGSFTTESSGVQIEALEKGGSISEYIKKILLKLYPTISVIIDDSAKSKTLQDKQTYQNKFSKLEEVSQFADKFGLKLAVWSNSVKIYDPYSKKKNTDVAPFIPKEQDFLTQPEMQSLTEVQCVFALNASLQLGQLINFPSNMAVNAGSLTSDPSPLAGISNTNALLTSGDFTITGIWHTGDSRNSSAEAWATTVSAVKATDNLAS